MSGYSCGDRSGLPFGPDDVQRGQCDGLSSLSFGNGGRLAFALNGNDFIYFAACKNHIAIFPPVKGDAKLKKELAPYLGPKGSLKFPLAKPLPFPLIERVIRTLLISNRPRKARK